MNERGVFLIRIHRRAVKVMSKTHTVLNNH